MRVYGGAQGIWVDKKNTAKLTSDGEDITVSILHTGRHYPDDLSNDGVIYHSPTTDRLAYCPPVLVLLKLRFPRSDIGRIATR
jgi:hypothetical protein